MAQRHHCPTVKKIGIEVEDEELDLLYDCICHMRYVPEEKQTWDSPGNAAHWMLEKVEVKGVIEAATGKRTGRTTDDHSRACDRLNHDELNQLAFESLERGW